MSSAFIDPKQYVRPVRQDYFFTLMRGDLDFLKTEYAKVLQELTAFFQNGEPGRAVGVNDPERVARYQSYATENKRLHMLYVMFLALNVLPGFKQACEQSCDRASLDYCTQLVKARTDSLLNGTCFVAPDPQRAAEDFRYQVACATSFASSLDVPMIALQARVAYICRFDHSGTFEATYYGQEAYEAILEKD